MIFKTKADITKHIAVNANFELSEITPSYNQAVNEYIVPALSRAFYDEIAALVYADATADQKKVIDMLQAALAPYTYFLYSFIGSVQIGSQGVQETSSSNNQPARQWAMYDFRKSLIRTGDTALDTLLEFLESKKDDFPTWKDSPAYTLTVDLFFSQAGQMHHYCNMSGGRRTYLAMRPYISRAERQYIKSVIGEELFIQLKDQLKAGNVSDDYKKLIEDYIRPALAPLSLMKAIPELSLELSDEGIKFKSFDNGITKRNMPALEDKSVLMRALDTDGNAELKVLEGFLIKNADKYDAFKSSQSWLDFAAIAANPQLDFPNYDAKICAV
jgi:hypothetical protein